MAIKCGGRRQFSALSAVCSPFRTILNSKLISSQKEKFILKQSLKQEEKLILLMFKKIKIRGGGVNTQQTKPRIAPKSHQSIHKFTSNQNQTVRLGLTTPPINKTPPPKRTRGQVTSVNNNYQRFGYRSRGGN